MFKFVKRVIGIDDDADDDDAAAFSGSGNDDDDDGNDGRYTRASDQVIDIVSGLQLDHNLTRDASPRVTLADVERELATAPVFDEDRESYEYRQLSDCEYLLRVSDPSRADVVSLVLVDTSAPVLTFSAWLQSLTRSEAARVSRLSPSNEEIPGVLCSFIVDCLGDPAPQITYADTMFEIPTLHKQTPKVAESVVFDEPPALKRHTGVGIFTKIGLTGRPGVSLHNSKSPVESNTNRWFVIELRHYALWLAHQRLRTRSNEFLWLMRDSLASAESCNVPYSVMRCIATGDGAMDAAEADLEGVCEAESATRETLKQLIELESGALASQSMRRAAQASLRASAEKIAFLSDRISLENASPSHRHTLRNLLAEIDTISDALSELRDFDRVSSAI